MGTRKIENLEVKYQENDKHDNKPFGAPKKDPIVGLGFKPQVTTRTHGVNIRRGTTGPNGPNGPKRRFFNGTRKIEILEVKYQNDGTC